MTTKTGTCASCLQLVVVWSTCCSAPYACFHDRGKTSLCMQRQIVYECMCHRYMRKSRGRRIQCAIVGAYKMTDEAAIAWVCAASVRASEVGRYPQPETLPQRQICLGGAGCLACWDSLHAYLSTCPSDLSLETARFRPFALGATTPQI